MNFEENIKEWVQIDNQLKKINETTKALRTKKSELSEKLFTIATEKQYLESKINISDGNLRFVETKQASPITLGFLKTCLGEIINSEEKVDQIMDHIKSRRETKLSSEIKRTYK